MPYKITSDHGNTVVQPRNHPQPLTWINGITYLGDTAPGRLAYYRRAPGYTVETAPEVDRAWAADVARTRRGIPLGSLLVDPTTAQVDAVIAEAETPEPNDDTQPYRA